MSAGLAGSQSQARLGIATCRSLVVTSSSSDQHNLELNEDFSLAILASGGKFSD